MNKIDLDLFRELESKMDDAFFIYKYEEPYYMHHKYRYQIIDVGYSPDVCDYKITLKCLEDLNIYDIITLLLDDFLENYIED